MSDDWKGEDKLQGIKAPRGEGNGYNMPNSGKALKKRALDAKRKAEAKRAKQRNTGDE